MNKELIETTLAVALKDKKISNYFMASEIGKVLVKLFEETREDLVKQGYKIDVVRSDNRTNVCTIRIKNYDKWGYKSYGFATIEVKRTKDWRDDYYFKDFEVITYRSLDEEIEVIDKNIAKQKEEEQRKRDEAVELCKVIIAKHPSDNEYALRSKLDYLYNNFYSIYDEIKGVK